MVEAQGVDAGGQFDPADEAAVGPAEAGAGGKMAEDGLGEEVEVAVVGAADRAEVVAVAAVAEEIGSGFREDDGRARCILKLDTADAFEVAAGGAPADAEGRGEGFAEAAAEEDAAVGVPGLEGFGAAPAEVEVAVKVVFDDGDVELGKEGRGLARWRARGAPEDAAGRGVDSGGGVRRRAGR